MSALARAERHWATEPDPGLEWILHDERLATIDADREPPADNAEAVRVVARLLWRYSETVAPVVIHAAITVEFQAAVLTLEQVGDLITDWPNDGQFDTPAARDDFAETLTRSLGNWRAAAQAERPRRIRSTYFSRNL